MMRYILLFLCFINITQAQDTLTHITFEHLITPAPDKVGGGNGSIHCNLAKIVKDAKGYIVDYINFTGDCCLMPTRGGKNRPVFGNAMVGFSYYSNHREVPQGYVYIPFDKPLCENENYTLSFQCKQDEFLSRYAFPVIQLALVTREPSYCDQTLSQCRPGMQVHDIALGDKGWTKKELSFVGHPSYTGMLFGIFEKKANYKHKKINKKRKTYPKAYLLLDDIILSTEATCPSEAPLPPKRKKEFIIQFDSLPDSGNSY